MCYITIAESILTAQLLKSIDVFDINISLCVCVCKINFLIVVILTVEIRS